MTVGVQGEVKLSAEHGVIKLIVSRPPLNVLSINFMRQFEKELRNADTISDARVLAIVSASKAFCAGVDIADHTAERTEEMLTVFHGLIRLLYEFPIPTVAIVNGAALGGGFELALSCDIILASEKARFAVPEITLGVFPPVAMAFLPRVIGYKKASELIFTGTSLSAVEGQQLGLVNAVYPVDELEVATEGFLAKFRNLSRTSLIETKRAFRQTSLCGDLNEALQVAEKNYLQQLMLTDDAKEGIAAFMEKREPMWSHR